MGSMAPLKQKGDTAELAVALDLRRRGYRISFPFGEDSPYDLVVDRNGVLERVQVKHETSDGRVVKVRCRALSLTNGRVRAVTRYTAHSIDWLAVFDATTECCFYVPATVLGEGRAELSLRLVPARNGQLRGVRPAAEYLEF
jgi:hypothetical protein